MCLPANSCALLSPHCLWPGGVPSRGAAGQAAVPERSPCSITGAARRTPRGAFNSNAQRACAKGGGEGKDENGGYGVRIGDESREPSPCSSRNRAPQPAAKASARVGETQLCVLCSRLLESSLCVQQKGGLNPLIQAAAVLRACILPCVTAGCLVSCR